MKEPVDWKVESLRFDSVADQYETFRPGYPEDLITTIRSTSGIPDGGSILEIGSGTGIATEPFARLGYSILCIDPGKNLVAVARQKFLDNPRVRFEISRFEEWAVTQEQFDLVISAQAFHWVPEAGYEKAAQALKPGGWIALFWNMAPYAQGDIFTELQEAYRKALPEMIAEGPTDCEKLIQERESRLAQSGRFGPVQVFHFPYSLCYTLPQYIGLLKTYSDHIRLSPDTRQELFDRIAIVITRHSGILEKPYLAVLYLARKLP